MPFSGVKLRGFSSSSLYLLVSPCTILKVKVKYLRGAFLEEPVTYVTRFSMPLEPSFGTMSLSSTVSQL